MQRPREAWKHPGFLRPAAALTAGRGAALPTRGIDVRACRAALGGKVPAAGAAADALVDGCPRRGRCETLGT